jgi:hypothetical protein
MRERRKRHARTRKLREAFAALVREGGILACAPDAFAKLDPNFVYWLQVGGVDVRVTPYVPRGMMYGIPKQPPLIERVPAIEWTEPPNQRRDDDYKAARFSALRYVGAIA